MRIRDLGGSLRTIVRIPADIGGILTIMGQRALYSERDMARVIRSARRQRGWTQARLAAQANVSTRVIEKLEASEGKTVNVSTILALLRALSIDMLASTRKGSPISLDTEDLEPEEMGF